MAIHTKLPIYKRGCELLDLAYEVQQHMPREHKRFLGEKITMHCTEMLDLMALANASQGVERAGYIRTLLVRVSAVQALLRVCFERKYLGHRLWARSIETLESIGRQGGGWLKSAKAPAA